MRLIVLRRPIEHYKLLLWMCVAIMRVSLGSVAFCEVEGSRFRRTFIAYTANVNGFKLRCRMILFVDGTHLSRPYGPWLLSMPWMQTTTYSILRKGIVCGEKIEEWVWFLETIAECLRGLKPVIMSNRNPS